MRPPGGDSALHVAHVREAGRLQDARTDAGPVAAHDFTSVLGIAGRGTADILFGVSSWEAPGAGANTSVPAVVGVSAGGVVGALFAVPILGASKAIYLALREDRTRKA